MQESTTKEPDQELLPKSSQPPDGAAVDQLDDSYDPYEHGKKDGIGKWGAVVHVIRTTVGIGILMMPYLLKRLGYVTGILLMMGLGLVYYHTVHILLSVEYKLSKMLRVGHLSFVGVTDKVLTRAAYPINKVKPFVYAVIYFYYGLPVSNTTILIVISTNIKHMAEHFHMDWKLTHIISVIVIPYTLCCMHKRILQILVPFSWITNIFTFVMIGIVAGFSVAQPNKDASPRAFNEFLFIPQALATFIMSVRCTGIVIPLKNDMAEPRKFTTWGGSLNIAGLTIMMLYAWFGLIAYFNYGDEAKENVLSNLPAENDLSFVIYVLYSLALTVNYILQFFLRFQTVWSGTVEEMLETNKYKIVFEYGLRLGINLLAYLLAVGVPYLALISAISGTIGILVEIALPSILEILLAFIVHKKSFVMIFKNLCIVGISCVAFTMSTISVVKEIKKIYS